MDASRHILHTCFWFVAFYMAVRLVLARIENMPWVDIFYFISATVTTIGLGDISPQTQLNRGIGIVLLPYGLVVIST